VWRDRARSAVSQLAAAGAVAVLFGYLSLASDAFLSTNNLLNIGVQSAVVAIIAIGMTMVIITAGIDLSVGSVAALSGVLGAMMVVGHGVPVPVAIIGGAAIGAIAGVVNGLLVTQGRMAPFIATLGMLSVARGLVYIVTNSVAVSGAPPEFTLLGQGKLGALPIPILALVVVALAGHFVLTRTKLGRYSYAMGSNVEAARLSGIRSNATSRSFTSFPAFLPASVE
jgi:ribose transport system permease protein